MKLTGIFTIRKYNKAGVLLKTAIKKNVVVYDGMYCLALFINGGSTGAFTDISIGTGTSTAGALESDSALFSWYMDKVAAVDWTYPNIAKWSAEFNFTETVTITEMAITKATHSILFNHLMLDVPMEYHNGEFMIVDYQVVFAND